MCGAYGNTEEHHIFEGSNRQMSEHYGLKVNVCRRCHTTLHSSYGNDERACLHAIGQKTYEDKIGSREKFIEEFIRSYL